MNPGRLDRKITLQRFTSTKNAIGEALKTWATYAIVPAAIKPQRGGERVNGDKREAADVVTFQVRYYQGVVPKDRLLYEGVNYDVLNIRESGRRHLMEIDARRQA
jgi:SPP1 family predicted phage head-tail adaptor